MIAIRITFAACMTIGLACSVGFGQTEIAWTIASGPQRTIDPIESVLIDQDTALVGIDTNAVGIYDLASGALLRDIVLPIPKTAERRTFAASNGKLLMSNSVWAPNGIRGHSSAYVFDIETGQQLTELALPHPSLRLGLGSNLATHGNVGLLTSIGCLDTCFDPVPTVRGVVDAFDLTTGEHLYEIVSSDDSVFGQGLAVDASTIAVSARSRNLDVAGRVYLYDVKTGDRKNVVLPRKEIATHHGFGFDLAISDGNLIVGDNPDVLGHGLRGDGRGAVSVYDLSTAALTKSFGAADAALQGTSLFGRSVDGFGGKLIVGAPGSGQRVRVANSDVFQPKETGACAESFRTGGPCFERPTTVATEGTAIGQVQFFDIETGGVLSRPAWTGADSVALSQSHALVQTVSEQQSSVYAISLAGFFPDAKELPKNLISLGDLNRDGEVAFGDFLVLSGNFNKDLLGAANGDLDQNGRVEFSDFLVLSSNYGSTAAAATVPEPRGAGTLFGIVVLSMLSRRRR